MKLFISYFKIEYNEGKLINQINYRYIYMFLFLIMRFYNKN